MFKLLWISTQDGHWLSGWQNIIRKLGESGHSTLEKWAGACELCCSMFFAILSVPLYYYLLHPIDVFGGAGAIVIWLFWGMQANINWMFIRSKNDAGRIR